MVRDMMRENPEFASYVESVPVLLGVVQTTQNRLTSEMEGEYRHLLLRYIHLRLIRAVVSVLRHDPGAVVELSFSGGTSVELMAHTDNRHTVFHMEVRRDGIVQRESSFWKEDEFVRDLVRILIRKFPTSIAVYRSAAATAGKVRPHAFIRLVDEVVSPTASNRRWFRLYNQEAL
jgi:hypothetical protein